MQYKSDTACMAVNYLPESAAKFLADAVDGTDEPLMFRRFIMDKLASPLVWPCLLGRRGVHAAIRYTRELRDHRRLRGYCVIIHPNDDFAILVKPPVDRTSSLRQKFDHELTKTNRYLMEAMVLDCTGWQDWTRGVLGGALGEFACREVAKAIGESDSWSEEVNRPFVVINRHIENTFKNRDRALAEVLDEVSLMQDKVLFAKNKVEGYYPDKWKEIKILNLTSHQLFRQMLEEYAPKYLKLYGDDHDQE